MALIDFTGFEQQVTNIAPYYFFNYSSAPSDTDFRIVTGRFGEDRAFQQYGGDITYTFRKNLEASSSVLIIGMAIYFPRISNCYVCIDVGNADANTQCCVKYNGDSGTVYAYRGTSTLLGETSEQVFEKSLTWFYAEAKFYLHATAGYIVVKINGTTVLNLTNQNTLATGSDNTINVIQVRNLDQYQLDDMYICDNTGSQNNDFLGDIRVKPLYPSANGTTNDGVASAGSNYQCVDESSSNDDTDYVTLDALNEIELYTLGDLPSTTYTKDIKGIKVNNKMKLADAGTRSIDSLLRTNSINYLASNDVVLSPTYAYTHGLWELNPDDSAAWEESDINALESGIKVTV